MVGKKVAIGDGKCDLLLYLMDVVEHSCMPIVSLPHTELLADMTEIFLQKFKNEFLDVTLKPKMHYAHCPLPRAFT